MPKGKERPSASCHPDRPHYAHGLCRSCDQKRRYATTYKGRYSEQYKNWTKNNPDKSREIAKRYYLKNKDKARERQRRSYERNKEERRAKQRERYRENSEYYKNRARQYAKLHPDKKRLYQSWRRVRIYSTGNLSTFIERQWRVVLFGSQCAYCGGAYEEMDHIIPLSKGGSDNPGNLVPACRRCNATKKTKEWKEWYREREFYNPKREKFIEENIW